VRETTEDLLSANRVLGEVDLRRPGMTVSRRQLAQGAVRPGAVVVEQVFGQYPAQVMLVHDQQLVEELTAMVPIIRSQMAFALGACGGLRRTLMPSAVNTASKDSVNCPARSLIRNLIETARSPRSIRKLRAACVVHEPSGCAVTPAR